MDSIIKFLIDNDWVADGKTQLNSFRTASLAYGGGSVVTFGGRLRFRNGDWKVTVGKRTVCFYRKPEAPETTTGTGRMAGRRVCIFRDWEQKNIPTKDVEQIKSFIKDLAEQRSD